MNQKKVQKCNVFFTGQDQRAAAGGPIASVSLKLLVLPSGAGQALLNESNALLDSN